MYLSCNSFQEFNLDPVLPPYTSRPDHVEKSLKTRFQDAMSKIPGKELELLIVILPDNNGSLYGMLLIGLNEYSFIMFYMLQFQYFR